MSQGADDLSFPASHRLARARDYQAVFSAQVRRHRPGPGGFALFSLPNNLDHPRLGLSIGARAGGIGGGSAVTRNRLKRLMREAFRLEQHNLPRTARGTSYDYVVAVRAEPRLKPARRAIADAPPPRKRSSALPLAACRTMLREMALDMHRTWERRFADAPNGGTGAAR